MKLTSPAFGNQEMMPSKFTCDGQDMNPPLIIEDVPTGAKSLTLIVDDPDAPNKTWTHWVVYDMPIIEQIEENSVPGKEAGNDFGQKEYGGPCPPSGTHRYFFRLYALDTELNLQEAGPRDEVEDAMKGHVLEQAELVGLYEKR